MNKNSLQAILALLTSGLLSVTVYAQKTDPQLRDLHNKLTITTGRIKIHILSQLNDFHLESNVDSAIYYSEKALALSKHINYKKGIASATNDIAYSHMQKGNFLFAGEMALNAIDLSEELQDDSLSSNAYQTLGVTYFYSKNYSAARENLERALEIANENKLDYVRFGVTMNLGRVFLAIDSFNLARKYTNESEQIVKRLAYDRYTGTIYNSYGDIYKKEGKIDLAFQYYKLALSNAKQYQSKRMVAIINLNLSDYFQQLNTDSALKYALKSIEISKQNKYPRQLIDASLMASNLYLRNNDYKNAYGYLALSNAYKDSLFNYVTQIRLEKLNSDRASKAKANEAISEENKQLIFICAIALLILAIAFSISILGVFKEEKIRPLSFIAFLIFFEALTLSYHVFAGRITNHIPAYIILLLIPFAYVLHWLEKRFKQNVLRTKQWVARAKKYLGTKLLSSSDS